ncbi:MAG: hypothetical protein H7Z20_04195 [Bdellovibrio sp.]|nr:hypothetical protein [Methylotenera sp.]
MKRLLKNPVKRDLQILKESYMDIWHSRFSHFSQIGLLVVAVFGYVYTVLPVYQKSLLDEQIAHKEIELTAMQSKLDRMYEINRSDVIKRFVFMSNRKCGRADLLPKNGAEIFNEKRISQSIKQKLGQYFDVDMNECLVDTLSKSKNLKESLKPEDFNLLLSHVETTSIKLNTLKLELQGKFDTFQEKATSNPEILAPLKNESIFYRLLEMSKSSMSEKEYQSELFDAQVNQGLLDIHNEFTSAIYKEIASLWK